MDSDLPPGLYDLISTDALEQQLRELNLVDATEREPLKSDELVPKLVSHFSRVFSEQLAEVLNEKKPEEWRSEIEQWLKRSGMPEQAMLKMLPSRQKKLNLTRIKGPDHALVGTSASRPDTPLGLSALLTGSSRSPALRTQLRKELESCDRADWLVSFVKWSGLRPLLETLKRFTSTPAPDGGPRLRLATTSYMGATDAKAIEELLKLPNVQVRVSYDTARTRLHAKAYIFHRRSGFGSAYIGSANVSKAALDEGLEWTAKISQHELDYLWDHATATFESHWEDNTEFSHCTSADLDDLRLALKTEKIGDTQRSLQAFFDLKPHAFQRAILEDIADERKTGETRHLVIAATGTGKTMIAAFDYRRLCRETNTRPRLLFLAHRREILEQARQAFRHVLKDHGFGELKDGNTSLSQTDHVFCTVQSWNSQHFDQLAPNHFAYVVMDEAHHMAADTYRRIVSHVRPLCLLGLTATPERADGADIRDDFGGTFTHEIRLPEAIDRVLLSPFHYYGIPDAEKIDFSRLTWQGGRYRQSDLSEVLDGNRERARWVLEQTTHYLTDIAQSRAVGFCVSKAHAVFMANYFNEHGVPAMWVTSDSSRSAREDAPRKLASMKINAIFCVDVFNEGVDIPAIDAVLFLRPTESLTIFLQQLGRGLRRDEAKSHLTVLDFIAPQHPNFRYANRFQALTSRLDIRIDRQIADDMPYIPAGCVVQLERRAKEIVLDNIAKATRSLRMSKLLEGIRQLQQQSDSRPTLPAMLNHFMLDTPDAVYEKGMPYDLVNKATNTTREMPEEIATAVTKGFRRLLLQDDTHLLEALKNQLEQGTLEEDTAALLHAELWGTKRPANELGALHAYLLDRPGLRGDLMDLIAWQQTHLHKHPLQRDDRTGLLNLHASYTRAQILLALGKGTIENPATSREGVLHLPGPKLDVFFADVHKSERDFSPTTMYEDYAITDRLFHWQSQSQTSADSPTGQRYIEHVKQGYTPMLFIRERKNTANGLTAPYFFAGPLRYLRHQGSRPMSITWQLEQPLPARVLNWARRIG